MNESTLEVQANEAVAAGDEADSSRKLLINIDNGGTLTDVCAMLGGQVVRTKTLTTPADLSRCLFDGLKKVSRELYGQEDLSRLLLEAEHIRYSTTQGTNALVERKGPRLGLILGKGLSAHSLRSSPDERDLFDAIVDERVSTLDVDPDEAGYESAALRAVNELTTAGANRIVVAFGGGADDGEQERRLKRVLLRKFPTHMLGAVPILYSRELADDHDHVRRTWSAVINAFLHPAMERFLYSAEHKLRRARARNPLLVFRNDGGAARVARTTAIKTYSSGPRGGMEGALALAQHYGFERLLTMDVGGTTTDIGLVEKLDGRWLVRADRFGKAEGVSTSFPLCDVFSAGVGGSSIIRLEGNRIQVGPESVGAAPGPACFGLGGRQATITDAFLTSGLLDPASYFGGELSLDAERAKAAIDDQIATPMGVSEARAAQMMEQAWVEKVADALCRYTEITPDTTLAAFGGGGPMVACRIAEAIGITRVVIPGLAAVFSAFGVGFSDITHHFQAGLPDLSDDRIASERKRLLEQAERAMYAEGADLSECEVDLRIELLDGSTVGELKLEDLTEAARIPEGAAAALHLRAVKPVPHARLSADFVAVTDTPVSPVVGSSRRVLVGSKVHELPVYRLEDQPEGAGATGPAVLEEAFFTCRLDEGWSFRINAARDVLLLRN